MRLGDAGVRTENPFQYASEWGFGILARRSYSYIKGTQQMICTFLVNASPKMIPRFLMSPSKCPTVDETDQYAVCHVCTVCVYVCACGPEWADVFLNIVCNEWRTTMPFPINSMPGEIQGNTSELVILPFIVWTPVKNLCFLTPYLFR